MLQVCAARGAGVAMACQSLTGNDVPNTMQKAAFSLKNAQSRALHLQLSASASIPGKGDYALPQSSSRIPDTAGSRKKCIRDRPNVTVELQGTYSTETYSREIISDINLTLKS